MFDFQHFYYRSLAWFKLILFLIICFQVKPELLLFFMLLIKSVDCNLPFIDALFTLFYFHFHSFLCIINILKGWGIRSMVEHLLVRIRPLLWKILIKTSLISAGSFLFNPCIIQNWIVFNVFGNLDFMLIFYVA